MTQAGPLGIGNSVSSRQGAKLNSFIRNNALIDLVHCVSSASTVLNVYFLPTIFIPLILTELGNFCKGTLEQCPTELPVLKNYRALGNFQRYL